MSSLPVVISAVSLCVSALALWRTRTSLSVFQEEDGTIQVTNNSQHAVTLVELGMFGQAEGMTRFEIGQDAPKLPYRLDARDTVSFEPSLGMRVVLSNEEVNRREYGVYTRMASGQWLGHKGRVCSNVSLATRWYWRARSAWRNHKPGT